MWIVSCICNFEFPVKLQDEICFTMIGTTDIEGKMFSMLKLILKISNLLYIKSPRIGLHVKWVVFLFTYIQVYFRDYANIIIK